MGANEEHDGRSGSHIDKEPIQEEKDSHFDNSPLFGLFSRRARIFIPVEGNPI